MAAKQERTEIKVSGSADLECGNGEAELARFAAGSGAAAARHAQPRAGVEPTAPTGPKTGRPQPAQAEKELAAPGAEEPEAPTGRRRRIVCSLSL